MPGRWGALMASKVIATRAGALAGGGAFLLFLDRFFEGTVAYLVTGVGLIMVIVGLTRFFRKGNAT
jgi:hypothetical protein